MPSDARSRAPIREELAARLRAALVGAGLPVMAVYAYRVFDFKGQSPVVVVAPAGVLRTQAAMTKTAPAINPQSEFNFDLFVFVLASDAANGVTEADSDATIHDIEKRIADCIQDNIQNYTPTVTGGGWSLLFTRGATRDDSMEIPAVGNVGGAVYKRAVVPLTIRLLTA